MRSSILTKETETFAIAIGLFVTCKQGIRCTPEKGMPKSVDAIPGWWLTHVQDVALEAYGWLAQAAEKGFYPQSAAFYGTMS